MGEVLENPAAASVAETSDHALLGVGQGVALEEPAAVILHGRICEGGELRETMVDLNAHEAGNGG